MLGVVLWGRAVGLGLSLLLQEELPAVFMAAFPAVVVQLVRAGEGKVGEGLLCCLADRGTCGRAGIVVDQDMGANAFSEQRGDHTAKRFGAIHAGDVASQNLVAGSAEPRFRSQLIGQFVRRSKSWRYRVGSGEFVGDRGLDGAAVQPGMGTEDGDAAVGCPVVSHQPIV